jgi:hypothetical protein
MLQSDEAVRGALVSLGWTARVLGEVRVRERVLDVTTVFASREGVRADVCVARGEEAVRGMAWRRVAS